MHNQLRILMILMVGVILVTGCQGAQAEGEAEEEINLREVNCEKIEVSLGANIDVYYLIKVDPKWVEYWYETDSKIDDIPYTKGYACFSHSLDSAKEWEQDFGNQGLYISRSNTHGFNAVYIGGDPFEITSWVFIEPGFGEAIEVGSHPYSFPINVYLEYKLCEGGDGIDLTLRIIWETNNSRGLLYRQDGAGNLTLIH